MMYRYEFLRWNIRLDEKEGLPVYDSNIKVGLGSFEKTAEASYSKIFIDCADISRLMALKKLVVIQNSFWSLFRRGCKAGFHCIHSLARTMFVQARQITLGYYAGVKLNIH